MQHLPRHVRRIRGRKKHVSGRNFLRLSCPPHRNVRAKHFHFARVESRGNKWSPNRPWRYTIHPNALLSKIERERSRESDNRGFGGRIVNEVRTPSISCD